MNHARRLVLVLLAVAATVSCDRVTKDLASSHLPPGVRHSYLADTVRLEYAENTGAFLGLGSRLSGPTRFWVFTVGTAALLGFLGFAVVTGRRLALVELVAWSCLLGGGISNLADRAVREGAVVDFLNVGVGPVRTGIFNVADMAITGGALLLLLGRPRGDEPGA
jgi:signal peptidase II